MDLRPDQICLIQSHEKLTMMGLLARAQLTGKFGTDHVPTNIEIDKDVRNTIATPRV